jgi:hypothetical protein
MLVILATQEAEISRIVVQSQSGKGDQELEKRLVWEELT